MGYGDGDEITTIDFGGDSQHKYITSYFRKIFTISESDLNADQFMLEFLKDDGAIVYLNGNEIVRSNMADEETTSKTTALSVDK